MGEVTEVDLPLSGPAHANVDEIELDAISAAVNDAYVNELDHTVRRPGLEVFTDLGTGAPIDGMYWWAKKRKVLAVSAGKIFIISDSGQWVELSGGFQYTTPGRPVIFDNNGDTAVLAYGGQMITASGAMGSTHIMVDPDAPTLVTHVAYLDNYILAIQDGKLWYCDVGNPLSWDALSFFAIDGAGDNLLAMHTGFREIMLWGEESTEIWYNDGSPFTRLPGGFLERVLGAVYSIAAKVTKSASTWLWLDQNRRLVHMQNRTPVEVSIPFDRILGKFSRVDDCQAFLLEVEGQPLYVMSFPSEQRTLVYNYKKQDWYEWGYWNQEQGKYQDYRGRCACYAATWGRHLVGDRVTGLIYEATRRVMTDNGSPIRTSRTSGHITHGTYNRKSSSETLYYFKRGVATADVTNPKVMIQKRRNNGQWGNEMQYALGAVGNHEFFVRDRGSGEYRSLQIKVSCSDGVDFIFVGAKEKVEVLPS